MAHLPWPRIWVLFLGAWSSVAFADEVTLKNGAKLEGTIQEDGDKVIVDVGNGTIVLNRSEIRSISKPDELVQDYDRRYGAVKPDDAEGYYRLALWARQNGLKSRSERLLKSVIDLDPNHEGARRSLGYIPYKGGWLTQDEFKSAIGLVRYRNEWVSVEAAERLRKLDDELLLAQMRQTDRDQRHEQELRVEREKIALRQRALDMLREQGALRDFMDTVGFPWSWRYWGPAGASRSNPAAE